MTTAIVTKLPVPETDECTVEYDGEKPYVVAPELLDHIENARKRLSAKRRQVDDELMLNEVFRHLMSGSVNRELLFELAVYANFICRLRLGCIEGLWMSLGDQKQDEMRRMIKLGNESGKFPALVPPPRP